MPSEPIEMGQAGAHSFASLPCHEIDREVEHDHATPVSGCLLASAVGIDRKEKANDG